MTQQSGQHNDATALLQSLHERLAAVENSGQAIDAVRLCFTRRLIERSLDKPDRVRQKLLERINNTIDALPAQQQTPPAEASGDTKPHALDGLKKLTASLNREAPTTSPHSRGIDFDDFLREQEKNMLDAMAEPGQTEADSPPQVLPELAANRRFRQLQLQKFADTLLQQSIQQAPENPGPLNPQMLAIRSLSAMRDLSPHYLNRFVAYIDSLFWLEQSGHAVKKAGKKSTR